MIAMVNVAIKAVLRCTSKKMTFVGQVHHSLIWGLQTYKQGQAEWMKWRKWKKIWQISRIVIAIVATTKSEMGRKQTIRWSDKTQQYIGWIFHYYYWHKYDQGCRKPFLFFPLKCTQTHSRPNKHLWMHIHMQNQWKAHFSHYDKPNSLAGSGDDKKNVSLVVLPLLIVAIPVP